MPVMPVAQRLVIIILFELMRKFSADVRYAHTVAGGLFPDREQHFLFCRVQDGPPAP